LSRGQRFNNISEMNIHKKAAIRLPCRDDWIRTSDLYVPNVAHYRPRLVGVHPEKTWGESYFDTKNSGNCLRIKSLFLDFFRYRSKSVASFLLLNGLIKIYFQGPRFRVDVFIPLLWPSNLPSISTV